MHLRLGIALTLSLIAPLLADGQAASEAAPPPTTFRVVPTPNPNFNNGLQAVSASSANDIWAVGEAAMHYDGKKWTAFPLSQAGGAISNMSGVADFSPTLAWAVGDVNVGEANPNQVIEQWNGTEWSVFPGPTFAAGDQPNLKGLTAISSDDMWAVGDLLADGGELLYFLFEHWDGSTWTPTTVLSGDAFLFGVSADASNDAWAVGFNGPENDDSLTLAMHYNGASWETVNTPNVGAGANQFNAAAALAPNNIWAVGFSTPVAPPAEAATLTLIEHYDGTSWSVVASPNVGPNSIYQSNRLFGITAVSANDIYAFGSYFASDGSGHQKTLLEHWNGTSWTIAPSPNPTKSTFLSDLLMAGVLAAPDDLWIVGDEDEAPHGGSLAINTNKP
jgi:hypothetical protein